MEELTDREIEQRLNGGEGVVPSNALPATRYIKPLRAAADSLIDVLQIEDGITLGLDKIDFLTRGFRRTDFVIVTGFAHSAKTQLTNTMILNNPDRRVLFFSLDDPAEMILAKLVAMSTDVPAERLEHHVKNGEEEVFRLIRQQAEERFSNLFVCDEVIGLSAMQAALAEAVALWGAPPHAIIIDYLEMIPGSGTSDEEGSNVKQMATALKSWAKALPCPLVCLHQGSRSNSSPGEPITLKSMGYSGEQQATIVIGTRRKRDYEKLDAHERRAHENTVTVHVVKNKRPGGRCTAPDGVDYHLVPETGLIRPIGSGDRTSLDVDNSPSAASVMRNRQGAAA